MLEFVNEPISVESRLRKDGTILPLAFTWRGQCYQIESWGRESAKEIDGRALHCYLIQTAGTATWELCHDIENAQWTITRHWARDSRII
jgi:hypothetical protein